MSPPRTELVILYPEEHYDNIYQILAEICLSLYKFDKFIVIKLDSMHISYLRAGLKEHYIVKEIDQHCWQVACPKTVADKELELGSKPVCYHQNGNVKFPVTYTQLLRETERLRAIVVATQYEDSVIRITRACDTLQKI